VSYYGGATKLENVYFVNCTFNFRQDPKAGELSTAILSSAGVNVAIPA
jgi:hypothetical protein